MFELPLPGSPDTLSDLLRMLLDELWLQAEGDGRPNLHKYNAAATGSAHSAWPVWNTVLP